MNLKSLAIKCIAFANLWCIFGFWRSTTQKTAKAFDNIIQNVI